MSSTNSIASDFGVRESFYVAQVHALHWRSPEPITLHKPPCDEGPDRETTRSNTKTQKQESVAFRARSERRQPSFRTVFPPPPQAPPKAGPWIPGIDVHVAESFQVGGWGVGFGGYGRVEAEPKRREAGGWGSGVDVELRRGLDCCESRTAVFRKLKTFLARAQTSLVLNPEIQKLGHLRATTPLRVRPDDVHPIVFDEGPPGGELLGRQVVVLDEF